jgi:putative endonuclease
MSFFVYVLKCADGSLYAGATNDLKKRLKEHNTSPRGAKYTKARRPVTLEHCETFRTLAKARAREAEIKRLPRAKKLELLAKG